MRHSPLPAALSREGFSVSAALQLGSTRRRVRGADLRRPHYGSRVVGPPPSIEDDDYIVRRCREYAPLLLDGHGFSHATAAALWGLPIPPRQALPDEPLHVVATGRTRAPRRPKIVGHTSVGVPLFDRLGVPVVHPLRAWIQCAETFGLDDVVAMGDALLSRWSEVDESSYRPLSDLERAVERAEGRRGAATLQRALPLCRRNVWSPQESKLRLLIVRCGRREPDELNQVQRTATGRWLGVADMAYPREKKAVEYEGKKWHDAKSDQFESDILKGERFAADGWERLRVTKGQMRDERELCERIVQILPEAI